MNDAKRSMLREAVQYLNRATALVDNVADKESDAMDNVPENLQGSDRYSAMEEVVDRLNDASEKIGDAAELVASAMKSR